MAYPSGPGGPREIATRIEMTTIPLAVYEMACDRARFWERLAWTFMGTTLLAVLILAMFVVGLAHKEARSKGRLWAEIAVTETLA